MLAKPCVELRFPLRSCGATLAAAVVVMLSVTRPVWAEPETKQVFTERLNVNPPHISTDPAVKYDYDIVYVRAQRAGDQVHKRFYTDIATPVTLEPGADLMLLHPDGTEELLVAGGEGAITDPVISLDGESVFYTQIYTMAGAGSFQPPKGADIYKLHLPTRKITRLTQQVFTPNTGAADWAADPAQGEENKTHLSYGVLNFGAYPLPGGRLVFTSNRNAFRPPKGYPRIALQLFVMDEYGGNVEQIGYLNIAGALHPVVLTDGRIIFSSLESQGSRGDILWGIWAINADGTYWAPVVSAFDPGGAPNAFHFQSQLSDGTVIVEQYYNQNNSGFGSFIKVPLNPPAPAFGPAQMSHAANRPWRFGRHENGNGQWYRMPFMPIGSEVLTPFARVDDGPAGLADLADKNSPKVGKVTHPSGAPDNHLLAVWSPGPTNHQYTYLPQLDGGIYLIKDGRPVNEPGQMLLIKNDPKFNEQWPRAVVPYRRIYGIDEPARGVPLANDGKLSKHLPAGTPFGLVGSSSLYKRESYPNGVVPTGSVTSTYGGGNDPWRGLDAFTSHGNGMPLNWHNQGADAGLYSNDDIHAVRILAMEPTTDRNRGPRSGRLFHSHANERLRILGEIPVRKWQKDGEPSDPDGNPDTSFLAKIPADTAFTFQTIDRDGMVLNMSQTWHQLRPGEVRHDCGGCHAHSQQPTLFADTLAAKDDYPVWNLVDETPLVTAKASDASQRKWDSADATGLKSLKTGVANVEYQRDVRPIFARSCVACHTAKAGEPAGNLVLDADDEQVQIENVGKLPGTYARLAADERGKFGHKPPGWDSWGYPQASRTVRRLQSRRSLLTWKIYGRRLDGFSNDDHPSESKPGSGEVVHQGQPIDKNRRSWYDIDYVGSIMPPPAAIAGEYRDASGKSIKVAPLSDEDRRTIVRWIDLGCPIDLDYDPARPNERGYGWMCDDNRPIVALTIPRAGANARWSEILIGMADYYSGLEPASFSVTADADLEGLAAGTNLASMFKVVAPGVWQLKLAKPVESRPRTTLTVSICDSQGNVTRVERSFWVGAAPNPRTAP